ncbi:hypothetical protein K3495_g9979 [Podosphaera aphanis]|nr:hypothetical protein K3495_g9979 [Podosphaera aphanis]
MLPSAQLTINNKDNASTGLSPFFLEHGYHIEPIQQIQPNTSEQKSTPSKMAEKFISRISDAQEYASAAMPAAQQQMEEQANRKRNPASLFHVGDKVWLSLKNIVRI